jgi:hypothetical protein
MLEASCRATIRLQVVGQGRAVLGLALGEGVAGHAVGVGQVVDAGQQGLPKYLRLVAMPPTEMPPKPTP